jgi:hypothetical protein
LEAWVVSAFGGRLGHQFQDRHVGLACTFIGPALVAHQDFQQLVHGSSEVLHRQQHQGPLEARRKVALVGGDGRFQLGHRPGRRRALAGRQPDAQGGQAGIHQHLTGHRVVDAAGFGDAACAQQQLEVLGAGGIVGRVDGHGLGQLGQRGVGIALFDQDFRLLGIGSGLHLGRAGHMFVEELADLHQRDRTDKTIHRLALREHHAEGDRAHAEHLAELAGDFRHLVAVELGQHETAGVLLLHLFQHRAKLAAGAAPRCPDVQQHGLLQGGLDQFGFKVLQGDVDHWGTYPVMPTSGRKAGKQARHAALTRAT